MLAWPRMEAPPRPRSFARLRLAVLGALLAALALAVSGSLAGPVALLVDGEPVTLAALERAAALVGTRPDDPALIGQVVNERLLLREAKAAGLEPSRAELAAAVEQARVAAGGAAALRRELAARGATVASFRRELRDRLLLLAYAEATTAAVAPTDEAVRARYEADRGRLTQPARWGATLLCYDGAEAAAAARTALLDGTPLDEAFAAAGPGSARTVLSPSETGPVRARLLALAQATPFGRPSEVVPVAGRACLLVPERFFRARTPAFEEVEASLRGLLEQEALQREMRARLLRLRAEAELRFVDLPAVELPPPPAAWGREMPNPSAPAGPS